MRKVKLFIGKSPDFTLFPFYKTLYVLHVQNHWLADDELLDKLDLFHYSHNNKKDLDSCIIIIRYYLNPHTINIHRLWKSLFFS
jgi:hypothetical protein